MTKGFEIVARFLESGIRKADYASIRVADESLLPSGAETDDILVVDSTEWVKEFALWFKTQPEYEDVTKELQDEYNRKLMDDDYVDILTDDQWEYVDETFECEGCYKTFPMYANSVEYTPKIQGEYGCFCVDCFKNDDGLIEDYVAGLVNNPDSANTVLDRDDLHKLGFEKVNVYPFENGCYAGQDDDPKKIYAKYASKDKQLLFSVIRDGNPFQCCFNLYERAV